MSKTQENIKKAFEGEAKAVVRLRLFADMAEEEGYPQLSKLFRAISEAELVHAKKHLKNMGVLTNTEDHLKYSFEQEKTVSEIMYPELIKTAIDEGDKVAEISFTHSRDAEEFHAGLYKKALDHFAAERDTNYNVCRVCGYVVDGEAPDECPVCKAPESAFFEVL